MSRYGKKSFLEWEKVVIKFPKGIEVKSFTNGIMEVVVSNLNNSSDEEYVWDTINDGKPSLKTPYKGDVALKEYMIISFIKERFRMADIELNVSVIGEFTVNGLNVRLTYNKLICWEDEKTSYTWKYEEYNMVGAFDKKKARYDRGNHNRNVSNAFIMKVINDLGYSTPQAMWDAVYGSNTPKPIVPVVKAKAEAPEVEKTKTKTVVEVEVVETEVAKVTPVPVEVVETTPETIVPVHVTETEATPEVVKVSRSKSERFIEAHKRAKKMNSAIRYKKRFSICLKEVWREELVGVEVEILKIRQAKANGSLSSIQVQAPIQTAIEIAEEPSLFPEIVDAKEEVAKEDYEFDYSEEAKLARIERDKRIIKERKEKAERERKARFEERKKKKGQVKEVDPMEGFF